MNKKKQIFIEKHKEKNTVFYLARYKKNCRKRKIIITNILRLFFLSLSLSLYLFLSFFLTKQMLKLGEKIYTLRTYVSRVRKQDISFSSTLLVSVFGYVRIYKTRSPLHSTQVITVASNTICMKQRCYPTLEDNPLLTKWSWLPKVDSSRPHPLQQPKPWYSTHHFLMDNYYF